MTRRLFLASFFVLQLVIATAHAQSVFTQTAEFCPVQISYSDLEALLARIHEFRLKGNAGPGDSRGAIEQVTLTAGATQLAIKDDFSKAPLSQGPEVAFDVWYWYRAGDLGRPIGEVTLRLGDSSRHFTASGTDRTQIDGLVSLVTNDFNRLGCSLGGSSQRLLGALFLLVLAMVMTIVAGVTGIKSTRTRVALILPAIAIYPSLFLLPWSDWFPGTAVRLGEISFVARNAPLIGFVGALLGLASLAISLVPLFRRSHSQAVPETDGESDSRKE